MRGRDFIKRHPRLSEARVTCLFDGIHKGLLNSETLLEHRHQLMLRAMLLS
jgi:hypothetical protein